MSSVTNLFKQLGTKWVPDSDAVNASEDVLLRADNLVPDQLGALVLRRGSSKLYTSLAGGDMHSLHTVELANGTTYRSMGVGDNLYINGSSYGSFTGSGDIAIGDDSYRTFYARGTTKKKFDGTHCYNWGIAAPTAAPTMTAVSAVTKSASTFASGESPAPTIVEGSGSIGDQADQSGTASQASILNPSG